MKPHYSNEKAVQIVIALLKKNNIKRLVVSPGSANDTFVYSVQSDSFFTLYSCIDERSAAYMACGIAEETNEPVAISCTGATASRNYIPALTEAYYRQLPIIAITATRPTMYVGHNIDQLMDRSVIGKDIVKFSVNLPVVNTDEEFWDCEIKVNKALSELTKNGGGPVHINLPTIYDRDYSSSSLPDVREIKRYDYDDELPSLEGKTIGIYIASHKTMSTFLVEQIDEFCEKYNSVVFCEHTSGYNGKYKAPFHIVANQSGIIKDYVPDIEIELGGIAGVFRMPAKSIWRICEDGEIRDPQKKLDKVFYMKEFVFFEKYNELKQVTSEMTYYRRCKEKLEEIRMKMPKDLPFSNLYVASKLAPVIPENSVVHFGILSSLRSWNYFDIDNSIRCYSNIGGYGIDGCVSSLIGASLIRPDKLYFGAVGDLAFFYDLNSLGNREIKNNVRILLINNGMGGEFKNYFSAAYDFGEESSPYICAEGHYGNKSKNLVKHYAEDLGFEYISAENKNDFEEKYRAFVNPEITDKPILFEVFTDAHDDTEALRKINSIEEKAGSGVKKMIKGIIGQDTVNRIKKVIK